MKKILATVLFLSSGLLAAFAQCTPDLIYQDSSFGVYPLPQSAANPNGGIQQPACIGMPYEFTFTAVVPTTVVISGISLNVDSIKIDSLRGLPAGLSYVCDAPNCVFPANSLGCIRITGTPTAANAVGNYDLKVYGKGFVFGQGISIQFPTPSTGDLYRLRLLATGNPECTNSTEAVVPIAAAISVSPNPFERLTQLQIMADEPMQAVPLRIMDYTGRLVQTQWLQLGVGVTTVPLAFDHLPAGLYAYQLGQGKRAVCGKLVHHVAQ